MWGPHLTAVYILTPPLSSLEAFELTTGHRSLSDTSSNIATMSAHTPRTDIKPSSSHTYPPGPSLTIFKGSISRTHALPSSMIQASAPGASALRSKPHVPGQVHARVHVQSFRTPWIFMRTLPRALTSSSNNRSSFCVDSSTSSAPSVGSSGSVLRMRAHTPSSLHRRQSRGHGSLRVRSGCQPHPLDRRCDHRRLQITWTKRQLPRVSSFSCAHGSMGPASMAPWDHGSTGLKLLVRPRRPATSSSYAQARTQRLPEVSACAQRRRVAAR